MIRSILAVILFVVLAPFARAEGPGPDPIAENLLPPDFVMRHAGEISLDDRQRAAIKESVQKAQSRFTDLQFDMQPEAEKMARLLQTRPIDEAAVLAQADKIMGLERELKKAHLALLVRIKNQLTAPQQDRLAALRRAR